jgi:PAS domain S-box-containing protein
MENSSMCSETKNHFFNHLACNSDKIIIVVDSDLRIQTLNEQAKQHLDFTSPDINNVALHDAFNNADLHCPLAQNYNHNPIQMSVFTEGVEWEIVPGFSNLNHYSGAMLIGTQINQKKIASIAHNLDQIVNVTPGSLYWKDLNGMYLGCNDFMIRTGGFRSSDDIIGKKDADLWPKNAPSIIQNDKYIIQSGETVFLEEEVTVPSGDVMYFTGVKMPLRDMDGQIIGVIGNSLDITKLKNTEFALKKEKKAAEEANKAKSTFIHNMEHDIRTPFNGVYGFANILCEQENDPSKKEFLSGIASCAKELLDYCDNILDFSRIEHGVMPILEKPFNMRELTSSVYSIEHVAAKLKNLDLSFHIEEDVPRNLLGDTYRVKAILLNLIGNSIKFTKTGSITVSITVAKKSKSTRNCVLKFEVKDTGIGISEEQISLIYEKFTRGTASNQGLYKGQGLGLRIVKQFVQELDGDINLTSTVNYGTTFTLALPFKIPLLDYYDS